MLIVPIAYYSHCITDYSNKFIRMMSAMYKTIKLHFRGRSRIKKRLRLLVFLELRLHPCLVVTNPPININNLSP